MNLLEFVPGTLHSRKGQRLSLHADLRGYKHTCKLSSLSWNAVHSFEVLDSGKNALAKPDQEPRIG